MRSEAEIREAMEIVMKVKVNDHIGIQTRDVTIEAFRYCLGIDDKETSPMSEPLADILADVRKEQEEWENQQQQKADTGSESVVTE